LRLSPLDPAFAALTMHALFDKTITLGKFTLPNPVFVAPMAGVTDRPFRQLCKTLGAGYAVSEMAASNPKLWASVKTARRLNHDGESNPKAVQIAGADPFMMAEAAKFNVERGAQIIDINMGCPAKKVCNVLSGSALMSNESLALQIIEAVVRAVDVPVTLKMRTGPSRSQRNALAIALAAQAAGIQMLTIHGRTRADAYVGEAEYDTIREVKAALRIPVVANGDIDSPEKALQILRYTGADAVMVGRAAQGNPWLLGEIAHYLRTGEKLVRPDRLDIARILIAHLQDHYAFYGEFSGVRSARKHVGWYLQGKAAWQLGAQEFLDGFNHLESSDLQLKALEAFFCKPTNEVTGPSDPSRGAQAMQLLAA
jgi:tRNA-dihydrouridine synthase B